MTEVHAPVKDIMTDDVATIRPEWAAREAARRGAPLRLVSAAALLPRMIADLVHGHPGRALASLSARADLVVLGRRSAHHGPGSVMHAVLSHAHGPVVTVPS